MKRARVTIAVNRDDLVSLKDVIEAAKAVGRRDRPGGAVFAPHPRDLERAEGMHAHLERELTRRLNLGGGQ